jgi:hypothetical protein
MGTGFGGVPDGTFVGPVTVPATQGWVVEVGDFSHDHVTDIAASDKGALLLLLAQAPGASPWHRSLSAWSGATSGSMWVGSTTRPTEDDRFGAAREPLHVNQYHPAAGYYGDSIDFLDALRASTLTMPDDLVPVTLPWVLQGDVRLTRVPEPAGGGSSGDRLRVEQRL